MLCEDRQHRAFLLRLCGVLGVRQLRIETSPSAQGGEQYVLKRYPAEVEELRSKAHAQQNLGLLVMIDADRYTVKKRHQQLDASLEAEELDQRGEDERIVLLVPRRNIETWIYYLLGATVDEATEYPKFTHHERDCQPAVEQLRKIRNKAPLYPKGCPPSLEVGCEELKRIE
jgi:hypothetical protein